MLPRCCGDVATLVSFAFPFSAVVVVMSQHCSSVKTFSTQCRDIGNVMSRHWPFFCTMLISAELCFFSLISYKKNKSG